MLLVGLRHIELLVGHQLAGLELCVDGLGGKFVSQTDWEEEREERNVIADHGDGPDWECECDSLTLRLIFITGLIETPSHSLGSTESQRTL